MEKDLKEIKEQLSEIKGQLKKFEEDQLICQIITVVAILFGIIVIMMGLYYK